MHNLTAPGTMVDLPLNIFLSDSSILEDEKIVKASSSH